MTNPRHISVNNVTFGNDLPFVLIAGPCQVENRDHALLMAKQLIDITGKLGIPFIYKSSYDKANRTSIEGKRGLGLIKTLPIFEEIRRDLGVAVLTDVHTEEQCEVVAPYVDILQIPAFLCRQTDMLLAAAKTGKIINIKKGQFLAPWDMKNVVDKMDYAGNPNVILTERGASFGYNTLVTDMRALWSLMPPTASSSRAGREKPQAETAASCRPLLKPPSPSALPAYSWKPTKTPTKPPPTGQIW